MKKILNLVEELGEGRYTCYKTKKYSLEVDDQDIVAYDDKTPCVSVSRNNKFAESDHSRVRMVGIAPSLIKMCEEPLFSYFLDGSRHIYKVDDIAIGNKIYPFMLGQIVVGCCERRNRDTFKKFKVIRKIVISLPKDFNCLGIKESNFCKEFCDEINENLKTNNYVTEHNIAIDELLLYPVDGDVRMDANRNALKDSGTAKIQSRMIQAEQDMVLCLCEEHRLDDEHFLIKDGSIEYRGFQNVDMSSVQAAQIKTNYKHVVGVSKMFNPDLMVDYEGHKLSKTIATLKPFERTKVYRYADGSLEFGVWYLRLRKSDFRETNFSDVVKCEMMLTQKGDDIDTDLVNTISANLIREAYPTCFGSDSRWGNHLYPVFLTESFCKSNYIDQNILLNLF